MRPLVITFARRGRRVNPGLETRLRKTWIPLLLSLLLLALVSCGGEDSGSSNTEAASNDDSPVASTEAVGGESSGPESDTSVEAAPPGQALVAVDNQEFTFELPGGVACSIGSDEFSFSFRIGDNEVTLGGGGFHSDAGWGGDISMDVPEPEGEFGVTTYFIDLNQHGDQVSIDGNSLTYSGPWMMRPPNDGTNPPPVDVGEGTLSVTCP